jgi:hypothetical protein
MRQQLRMGTYLNDLAFLQDHNAISILDGGQTVGDDKGRSAVTQPFQSLMYLALGLGIQV